MPRNNRSPRSPRTSSNDNNGGLNFSATAEKTIGSWDRFQVDRSAERGKII